MFYQSGLATDAGSFEGFKYTLVNLVGGGAEVGEDFPNMGFSFTLQTHVSCEN